MYKRQVEQVSFADLSEVKMVNTTIGEDADPFRATADGSWGGFVKAKPGKNVIEILARATDGSIAKQTVEIQVDPGERKRVIRRFQDGN